MADEHLAKQFLHELLVKERCLVKRRLYELHFRKNALENSQNSTLANLYRMKFYREQMKRRIPLYKNERQTMEKDLILNATGDDSDIKDEMEKYKAHGHMKYDHYSFCNLDNEIQLYEINLKSIGDELLICSTAITRVEKMLENKKAKEEEIRQTHLDVISNKT